MTPEFGHTFTDLNLNTETFANIKSESTVSDADIELYNNRIVMHATRVLSAAAIVLALKGYVSNGSVQSPTPPFTECGGVVGIQEQNPEMIAIRNQLLALHNEYRQSHQLPALQLDQALSDSALFYAADAVADEYVEESVDHKTRNKVNGKLEDVCELEPRAFSFFHSDHFTENQAYRYVIGQGTVTAEQLFGFWLGSPGHLAHIQDPEINKFGVGVREATYNGKKYTVVVVDFAKDPIPVAPTQTPTATPHPTPGGQPQPSPTPVSKGNRHEVYAPIVQR